MKNFNFWRSLFFAALAVVGFAACSDDDDNGGNSNGEASLTVNGKQSTTIGVKAAAGDTEAVEVVSSNPWTLAFETDQDWCVPSVTAAKGGTSSLKFTVTALPEGVEERSATAILSSNGEILGVPYTVKATIIIQQSPSGQAPVLIYKETFGTDKVGSNTDVDKYTKWNKTGEGAADVTYTGSKTSVRDSNPNNSDSYEGASGAPILFFGASPATFIVQNITLTPEQTNLQLTFGGQQTIRGRTRTCLLRSALTVRLGLLFSIRPTMVIRTAMGITGCWLPPISHSRLRRPNSLFVSCRLCSHRTCVLTILPWRRVWGAR